MSTMKNIAVLMVLTAVIFDCITSAALDVRKEIEDNVRGLLHNDHYLKFLSTKTPKFCNGLACPKYEVLSTDKSAGVEERSYNASQWVTTQVSGMSYDDSTSINFRKLFAYISGDNEKKEKVAMTAPVIVKVTPGPGPACDSNFTMSFFVDGDNIPPNPTASDVRITSLPKMKVFVKSFGGFANYDEYRKEGLKLENYLQKNKMLFNDKLYYTAGYDSPFRLFNRHNEVWLIAN